MAPTVAKFCFPTWRMLAVSCAVFILLSGVLATSDQRQCYWCGPLAEQIHRSRRAPACDVAAENVTTCDPGHTHCAMVATSPPYVESRYCVKFYQDECYSLYCSSTKTWRMTCPCRGDFCNGDKTEREKKAFASLAKLVTNTQNNRIKKRTSSSIVTSDRMQANIAANLEQNITNETDNSSEDMNRNLNTNEQNISNNANRNVTVMSDNIQDNTDATDKSNSKTNEEMDTIEKDGNKIGTTKNSNEHLISITTPAIEAMELPAKTTESIIDAKSKPYEHSTETHQVNLGKDIMLDDVEYKAKTPPAAIELNSPIKAINDNLVKPSEILPTAEALQQNVSPPDITEKPQTLTQPPTVATIDVDSTVMSTLKIDETATPELTKMKDNEAVKNIVNLYVIINSIFLYLVV